MRSPNQNRAIDSLPFPLWVENHQRLTEIFRDGTTAERGKRPKSMQRPARKPRKLAVSSTSIYGTHFTLRRSRERTTRPRLI